uniref:Uncharacterized protein n=1 Tax=Strigamia maritima TaxID=126957 RepID=T1ITU0_STRMM
MSPKKMRNGSRTVVMRHATWFPCSQLAHSRVGLFVFVLTGYAKLCRLKDNPSLDAMVASFYVLNLLIVTPSIDKNRK